MKLPEARCCLPLTANSNPMPDRILLALQAAYALSTPNSFTSAVVYAAARSARRFRRNHATELTGVVTLSLYKGNVSIVSRKSITRCTHDLSSFTMGASYDQKDAEGFIRILGLPHVARPDANKVESSNENVVRPLRQPLTPSLKNGSGRSLRPATAALRISRSAPRNALEQRGVLSSEELSEIVKAWEKSAAARIEPEFLNDLKPKTFTTL